MTKIDAVSFSWAGDKYLGRPYSEMDCQEFVERCMADCGLNEDEKGSNSWYRKVMKNGWTGTPEECMKMFGLIPKGALLFILEHDGNEPEKYQGDGIGNASHIGIKTGRNDGAIHSSSSRGCVATSKFQDKSINGGWNRIGLYNRFDYGKSINWFLEHSETGEKPPEEKEDVTMQAIAKSENGKVINMRKSPSLDAPLVDQVPSGSSIGIITEDGDWDKITYRGKTGWMMNKFIFADDSQIPDEDPDDFVPADGDPDDQDGGEKIALYFTAEELAYMLPILESACEQIIAKVGRG